MKTQKELHDKLTEVFAKECKDVDFQNLEKDFKGGFILLSADDTTEGVEAKCNSLLVGSMMSIAKVIYSEMLESEEFAHIVMNVAGNYAAEKNKKDVNVN